MNTFFRTTFGAIVCILLLFCANADAHEVRTPVIVDTDMALDDVRALALMLNSSHVHITGIVTTDGASAPEAAYRNVLRVLEFLKVDDIPVGVGQSLKEPAPPWRNQSESLGWSNLPYHPLKEQPRDAVSLVIALSETSDDPVTYICLGPMTTLAVAVHEEPAIKKKIAAILYFGTPPNIDANDWNTNRDPESVEAVAASGIPMYFFHLADEQLLLFGSALLDEIHKADSDASRLLDVIHQDARVKSLLRNNHFRCWDETIALYLEDPSLGKVQRIEDHSRLFMLSDWDLSAARRTYVQLLIGLMEQDLSPRLPVVLLRYPTNPKDLQADVRVLIPDVITRHGLEEWKATLLTNELHRHLGIYSIIGAKMGIRARELLGASLDELTVKSCAGMKPPLSCMNDGLQVSTGASLGRGTIEILQEKPAVAATFVLGEKQLHLSTKPEVVQAIHVDVERAIEQFGNLTPEYFGEIRRLSIYYWREMDRRQIFDEQMTAPEREP
jgi:pyrimidine-specific ribonucleoside hydrolase